MRGAEGLSLGPWAPWAGEPSQDDTRVEQSSASCRVGGGKGPRTTGPMRACKIKLCVDTASTPLGGIVLASHDLIVAPPLRHTLTSSDGQR